MKLTVGSLFSGIGGIDKVLEDAGFVVKWQVEQNEFCQKVLEKHWPSIPRYSNIKEIDPQQLEYVDMLAGGPPCQPVSLAGKRKGQSDDRWLWPEFYRFIRILRPRYILLENVSGLLIQGFGSILGDLAACGYDAEWQSLPASAFGAPHRRDRVYLVAYSSSEQRQLQQISKSECKDSTITENDGSQESMANSNSSWQSQSQGSLEEFRQWSSNSSEVMADAYCKRLEEWKVFNRDARKELQAIKRDCNKVYGQWPTQSRLGGVVDGLPSGMDEDLNQELWEHGIARAIEKRTPYRKDRLQALGNAVVPVVAEFVGRCILNFHNRSVNL